ncbi:MAG: oxidoreductase [Sphingobium sp.]|nr:MAG: oxidoreductase [Sphingobium sp.]
MIGQDPLDLCGQVAFVTGAGQGAGRCIALALARHNAGGVAINDFVVDRAEAVAAEVRALGVPAIAAPSDVGDRASVAAAMSMAQAALGPFTLLVNNAGNAGPAVQIGRTSAFWEDDPAEWDKFFRTNLYGVLNCCHVAIPTMVREGRGRIVAIVSDAGRIGEAKLAAYSAAKAGAAGFIRAIAREVGRYGITANAISLSSLGPQLEGAAMEAYLASERTKAQLSRYIIRRHGKGEDVANMALFLCSDAAAWITGQTYPVNGGYSLAQ